MLPIKGWPKDVFQLTNDCRGDVKLADKVSKVMMVMLFCMSRQDRERERDQ